MPRWLFWCYESLMAVLALLVFVLLALPQEDWVFWANAGIWLVFTADYVARCVLAKDRRLFLRRNLPDLVAILPFDFAFMALDRTAAGHLGMLAKFPPGSFEPLRALRLARAIRVLRLIRVVRSVAVLLRVQTRVREILRTNGLLQALMLVAGFVVAMGVAVTFFEEKIHYWYDGLWWSIVTAATVGYGDLAPQTWEGRVIAVILMVLGIGTLGMITGSVASYFVGRHQQAKNPNVQHIQSQLERWDELARVQRCELARMLTALAESPTAAD